MPPLTTWYLPKMKICAKIILVKFEICAETEKLPHFWKKFSEMRQPFGLCKRFAVPFFL